MPIFWFKTPAKVQVEMWTEAETLAEARENLSKGYWEGGEDLSIEYQVKEAEFMYEEPEGEIEE